MTPPSSEKNDISSYSQRGNDRSGNVLRWFDPRSWWLTMSVSGGIGSIITFTILLLWVEFGASVYALFLLGPLAGGTVAGYLIRKYSINHTLIGVASGLLAAFPVLGIVGSLIFASQNVEPLSDSWMEVIRTGGLGLSTSAGLTAIGALIFVFVAVGAVGRLVGSQLADHLLEI